MSRPLQYTVASLAVPGRSDRRRCPTAVPALRAMPLGPDGATPVAAACHPILPAPCNSRAANSARPDLAHAPHSQCPDITPAGCSPLLLTLSPLKNAPRCAAAHSYPPPLQRSYKWYERSVRVRGATPWEIVRCYGVLSPS